MKIACPFCALRCHDIKAQLVSGALKAEPNQCGLIDRRTAALDGVIDGLTLDKFQHAFQSLVAKNRLTSISIGGTIIDIKTARAAVRLASAVGGMVDVTTSACERSFNEVRERDGEIAATLGEMRERADSIVLLGHADLDYPRLLTHYARPADGQGGSPRLMVLASTLRTQPLPDNATMMQMPAGGLREVLRSTLASMTSKARKENTVPDSLASWLLAGKYTVWVGEDQAIEPLDASIIRQIIEFLNRQQRAVRISLSESHTFRSVAAWLTGLGGPLDFADTLPRLVDPQLQRQCQLRIWLQPLPDSPPPPQDDAKLLIIGAANRSLAQRADSYLRTAVPGIELAATTYRGDATVCLPIGVGCKSPFPSAEAVLDEIATCVPLKQDPLLIAEH